MGEFGFAGISNGICLSRNGRNFARFNKEKLSIPDDYNVEIMIAIGKHGKIEDLPEALRVREKPSDRKPLEEIVFEGKFPV